MKITDQKPPEEMKITDKVIINRAVITVLLILACLASMSGSAYAFFSQQVTSAANVIKSAIFEIDVTVDDGRVEVIKSQTGIFRVTFPEPATYHVTVARGSECTSSTGFCKFYAEGADEEYFTGQLGPNESVSFSIMIEHPATVVFLANWGTYAHSTEPDEVITDGETVEMSVPVFDDNESLAGSGSPKGTKTRTKKTKDTESEDEEDSMKLIAESEESSVDDSAKTENESDESAEEDTNKKDSGEEESPDSKKEVKESTKEKKDNSEESADVLQDAELSDDEAENERRIASGTGKTSEEETPSESEKEELSDEEAVASEEELSTEGETDEVGADDEESLEEVGQETNALEDANDDDANSSDEDEDVMYFETLSELFREARILAIEEQKSLSRKEGENNKTTENAFDETNDTSETALEGNKETSEDDTEENAETPSWENYRKFEAPSEEILPYFAELCERNSELFGWIRIEDTPIDYPVMLPEEEPEYYLDHDFDKNERKTGVPFLDSACQTDGPFCLIYGQNAPNGNMFGALLGFEEKDYWEEHKYINFDTLYEEQVYEIIAVFYSTVTDEETDKGTDEETDRFCCFDGRDLKEPESFRTYIETIEELSLYETGVTAEFGDELLVLATCEDQNENGRFVVIGKRIQSFEKNSDNDR